MLRLLCLNPFGHFCAKFANIFVRINYLTHFHRIDHKGSLPYNDFNVTLDEREVIWTKDWSEALCSSSKIWTLGYSGPYVLYSRIEYT